MRRIWKYDHHPVAGSNTQPVEGMGKLVNPAIKLLVSEFVAVEYQRGLIGDFLGSGL